MYILIKGTFFDDNLNRGFEVKKDDKNKPYIKLDNKTYLKDIPTIFKKLTKNVKFSQSLFL